MTTMEQPNPATIGSAAAGTTLAELLIGSAAETPAVLAAAMAGAQAVLARLSVAGLSIPGHDVASAVAKLLEMPIGNLAIKGWSGHRSVADAKRRTAENPGAREVVRLLDHRIKSKQKPEILVEINGAPVPLFELTLEVELRISSADVVVERGEVVDVGPGSVVAKGKLSAADVELLTSEFRQVELKPGVEPPPPVPPHRVPPPPVRPPPVPPPPAGPPYFPPRGAGGR